jgi:hypothetical protein
MSIRSNLALTVAPARRNEIRKQTLNRLVSVETAWLQALQAGRIRVNDGSVYEPVEPFTELDFEYVNGAKVSLLRDPSEPQRYHVAIDGEYQDGESSDDIEQARRNFEGVQAEVWDARRSNR